MKPFPRSLAAALVPMACSVCLAPGAAAQTYVVSELPTLDDGPWNHPYGVNVHGDVVGMSRLPDGDEHAVLWRGGVVIDLGTLGAEPSVARDINDGGEIVGQSRTPEGPWRGFRYVDGTMTGIGVLPFETCSTAHEINNAGVLVGASACSGAEPVIQLAAGADLVPLSPWSGAAQARDVNEVNTVVWRRHATVDGAPVELNGFDADGFEVLEAYGVNDADVVTGIATLFKGSEFFRAFVYDLDTDVMTTLPTFGLGESGGRAIDNGGRVVGYTWVFIPQEGSTVRGVLWENGAWHDLNEMIAPDTGWLLGVAEDISEAGHIIGAGERDGRFRGYLLTPRRSADFDADGTVDLADLLEVLGTWGPCEGCPADLDGDGSVGFADLLVLLGQWGTYAWT